MKRRDFLRRGALGLASLGLGDLLGADSRWTADARADESASGVLAADGTAGALAERTTAAARAGEELVTILHTNDVHSRIDPFPEDGGRNAGMAGAARRATLIARVRAENPRTLLVDAGDVFQGTPYFNLFKGEVDFKVMSALGYDAMTLGNHDFDAGVEGLLAALPHADFPLINANYDFGASPLASRVQPCLVRELGGVRVGLFGLGVILGGLVSAPLHAGVTYGDPLAAARRMVERLRGEQRCDLLVCLSHLGNEGYGGEIGDQQLAAAVEGIDLIVGGHSHTFMDEPTRVRHGGRETLVFQVGWAGIHLGRVDFRLRAGRVVEAQATALPVDRRLAAAPLDARVA